MATERGGGRSRLVWFLGLWAGSAAAAALLVYALRGLIGLVAG
jgi:hypothetical protein